MNTFYRIALAAVMLMCSFAGAGAWAADSVKAPSLPKAFAVKAHYGLDYCNIQRDSDRARHRLDVYSPKGQANCPVLFFVHGGAWTISSKDDLFGIYGYGTIAKCIAERGFVVV